MNRTAANALFLSLLISIVPRARADARANATHSGRRGVGRRPQSPGQGAQWRNADHQAGGKLPRDRCGEGWHRGNHSQCVCRCGVNAVKRWHPDRARSSRLPGIRTRQQRGSLSVGPAATQHDDQRHRDRIGRCRPGAAHDAALQGRRKSHRGARQRSHRDLRTRRQRHAEGRRARTAHRDSATGRQLDCGAGRDWQRWARSAYVGPLRR
jgi:hypothetical protein